MGYSGGFFSTFYKRPRSVLEAREVAGRGGVQEGGSALLSSFVCWKPHVSVSPLVEQMRGGTGIGRQLLCSLVQSLGRAGLPRCAGWLCSPGDLCGGVYLSLSLAVRFSAGRWLSPHRGRVVKEAWQRHITLSVFLPFAMT